jgi:hypothetical protein
MRQGSLSRGLLFFILLILVISLFSQGSVGQSEEKRILDDIGRDWSTDIILLYVETPNKFNPVYGTNITDKAVLDEISAIEETMDPQKDDHGEQDDVTFIMSISTMIKEINIAPSNIMDATTDELDPVIDPPIPPGENEYAIPEGQDEIDEIIVDIPIETRNLFVRDTNSDGIWDSGVIWIGTQSYSKDVLGKLDNIINRYHIDPDAGESDYNSRNEWWNRIDSGTIHCQITNLGYTRSYKSYYGPQPALVLVLVVVVIFILIGLLTISVSMLNSKKKKMKDKEKIKKKIMLTLIVFAVLITANILIGLKGDPGSSSPKIDQMSNEFDGGQMGMVIVHGSPDPGHDQELRGTGSMKDIEVLDAIQRFESDLEDSLINSPLNIIDIMKMIKVPEEMVEQIPAQLVPPMFQQRIEELANQSFWDAIHTAGQADSVIWHAMYGKSLQDSLINIFYNSLTTELRLSFVRVDYARSLLYFQIPMREEDQTDEMRTEINDVVTNHRAFIPASRFVLVDSGIAQELNNVMALKIMLPFGILAVGLIYYILMLNGIQALEKEEQQGSQENIVEGEAIFEDITDEEGTFYEEYPYPPPPYRP